MEGYTMDVHRTLQASDNTNSETSPTDEGDYATGPYTPSDASFHSRAPYRGFVPAYTPMVRMPLTITPEEIATLTKSPREDDPPFEKPDELSPKLKGDSSPSSSPYQESEKTGHKRKRSDQSTAEVGSIMEDMRQAGVQDGATATTTTTTTQQRPLGEGEAAFLSLVMQAANSEPIDDMSTEPAASLPDQLLESFIVRAHAMKDSSSSDDGLGVGKKRKFSEESDLESLPVVDDDSKNKKEYGLEVLRKGRSDALEGLSSLSRESSWSDDGEGPALESKRTYSAEEENARAMTDANPTPPKRRPGRPPKKDGRTTATIASKPETFSGRGRPTRLQQKMRQSDDDRDDSESGDRRFEEWVQAEAAKRPQRRGPGRPPKKQAMGGGEELFSFNEESLEGEKRDERGRVVGGRGVGIEGRQYERELNDADDEESTATMRAGDADGFWYQRRLRRNATVQTRRGDGARSGEEHELLRGKEMESENGRRASMNGESSMDGGDVAEAMMRERIMDEWNSDQDDEDEEEEDDDDEDEWHDDDEDESWVDWDASSEGEVEVEVTPEEDEEEAAVVAELKAAEEIRAVAEAVRREEEDLRRAIAASMATAAVGPMSMDDHQMVLSEPMPGKEYERAAVKVEPWVPAKTETPLTLRRLRPPWLDAFQEFQARGISLEECKAEVEHTWQAFVAEGTDKRAWIKVPPTVTTWEGIVEYVQERVRATQEEEDTERKERREKRKKELDQLAEDAKRVKEEEDEDAEGEKEEEEDDGEDDDGSGDDDEEDGESDDDDDDGDDGEEDGDGRRRSLYQRRTRAGSRKADRRRKKKRDMVAQLLDCFKEKDLEKVLVVNAAARKRKPPRKYGIDEWYNRG